METILIFGGSGFMGEHLKRLYPGALTPRVDITDPQAIAKALDELQPTVVINAAGKTGRPNVDWCEDHKEETIMTNVAGPLNILQECSKRGIYWVQLGSGCTYEGDNGGKGFSEEDPPNFMGSFYARTKAWADQMLKEFPVLQLRLRMPFDPSTHPRNLIMKLKNYKKVLDEKNSLTYLPDFLKALDQLVKKRATGIYNVVNPGVISPFEIMTMYKEIVDPSISFERLGVENLSGVVKAGRSNCMLSSKKLEKEGITLMPVQDAVKQALSSLRL